MTIVDFWTQLETIKTQIDNELEIRFLSERTPPKKDNRYIIKATEP